MKTKKILLSLSLFLGILSVNAQEWRGFIEIYGGTSTMQSDISFKDYTFDNVWNPLTFGLNYTMGIKALPQLYAGIGIGGYTALMNYDEYGYPERQFPSLYFPVFANVRWIPDISKKINPFVDLKIGYQLGVDLEGATMWEYYNSSEYKYQACHKNGLFLQPGVGVRFGRESAFNLGLAYNVSMGKNFVQTDRTNASTYESFSKNYGFFMVTFGADF